MSRLQVYVAALLSAFILLMMVVPSPMTTPTQNSGNQDLPAAIQNVPISPVVMRIGIVAEIVESDNITVRISGSDVLVRASYLWPMYLPLLGDMVPVMKQDAQWLVMGTMSGPINTLIPNASFEFGGIGSTPDSWSINVVSSGGGTPTFTKVPIGTSGMSGLYSADFGVDSVAAGNSIADAFSASIPAVEGSTWTAAIWIEKAFIDNDAFTFANNGGYSELTLSLQFLDTGGAVLDDIEVNSTGFSVDQNLPVYLRPAPGSTVPEAPPGTVEVRMKLHGDFTMSANSFTSFFLDYAILRQIS